jgi:SAM-dependent methyltransferase
LGTSIRLEGLTMRINRCRLCGASDFLPVIDLGLHPLADTFLTSDRLLEPETHYPLVLGLCGDCGHICTTYAIAPQERYQRYDYSYDSSNSKVSIQHFAEFAAAVIADRKPAADALIADAGSNVGTLLEHFQKAGFSQVLGVEPAANIANIAVANGVRTLNAFFDVAAINQIRAIGRIDILLSSNVVNHADDLAEMFSAAANVLAADGAFIFEVPYLLDLVEQGAFDTIYHEHVHYHGLKPLSKFMRGQGFSIYRVERIDYMCGSIRVYARLGGEDAAVIAEMISAEERAGLYDLATYRAFMERIRKLKTDVNRTLWEIRESGGKIIGLGAATKGNTLLNYCGIDRDLIEYVADPSPLKIGKYMPGSRIPIRGDDDIDAGVTHALILPWNIAAFLKQKLAHLGLKFYAPQMDSAANGGGA